MDCERADVKAALKMRLERRPATVSNSERISATAITALARMIQLQLLASRPMCHSMDSGLIASTRTLASRAGVACRAQSGMRLRTGRDLDSESELERAPPLPLPAVAGWAPRIGAARGPPSCAECWPVKRARWDRDGAMTRKGPLPADPETGPSPTLCWPQERQGCQMAFGCSLAGCCFA